ncbi:MAG: hypothetical protein ACMVP2_24325 [Imperialibacter sp.]|uniref:hypothetical protein n=1 Tax=Imperialibacter sp. TaxID=2038411 RepID=UPI0030D97F4D|tara:strand:- start:16853 stop:18055 length:1203 start_codon:yes stop_codon:yes gene_type:complete
MRLLFFISILFAGVQCLAQPFTLQPNASMYIEGNAKVFFSNQVNFEGSLDNKGTLILSKDVDFAANTSAGSMEFTGAADQKLTGSELLAKDLTLLKQGRLFLFANTIDVSGTLDMNKGYLYPQATKVHVSGGQIAGGSAESYIEGRISQTSVGNALYYPMGIDGYFNSLSLLQTSQGDKIAVEIAIPDASLLIPGDSLIGLADEAQWIVTKESEKNLATTVEVNFDGFELNALVNPQTIRAHRYGPVIAHLDPEEGKYFQLGIGSLTDTDSVTYGMLTSSKTLALRNEPKYVSLGRMPLSSGPAFFVPNIFAPRAALEENRLFRPFLAGVPVERFTMAIWDGYNVEMYNVNQIDAVLDELGWDGTTNGGATASEGVYYYSIQVVTPQGSFSKKGSFILLR